MIFPEKREGKITASWLRVVKIKKQDFELRKIRANDIFGKMNSHIFFIEVNTDRPTTLFRSETSGILLIALQNKKIPYDTFVKVSRFNVHISF